MVSLSEFVYLRRAVPLHAVLLLSSIKSRTIPGHERTTAFPYMSTKSKAHDGLHSYQNILYSGQHFFVICRHAIMKMLLQKKNNAKLLTMFVLLWAVGGGSVKVRLGACAVVAGGRRSEPRSMTWASVPVTRTHYGSGRPKAHDSH